MNWVGTAERIFTAPDASVEMTERSEVEAVAGGGLRGDRYFREIETGTFVKWEADEERPDGYDLTLIEQEAIAAIEREEGIELDPANIGGMSSPGTLRSTISSASGSVSVMLSVTEIDCVSRVDIFSASPGKRY